MDVRRRQDVCHPSPHTVCVYLSNVTQSVPLLTVDVQNCLLCMGTLNTISAVSMLMLPAGRRGTDSKFFLLSSARVSSAHERLIQEVSAVLSCIS